MSSNYPAGLDSLPTDHADNVGEIIHAATDNDQSDAINKIEATLGTNPHGTAADVKTRLAVSLNDDGTLKAIDTDGTLAADSDTKVASQKATKTYVDAHAGGGVTVDVLANQPTAATGNKGHLYFATDDATDGPNGTLYLSSGSEWLLVPRTTRGLLGWFDAFDYGALSDLRRVSGNASIAASSTALSGTFLASNGDAGKLVRVFGAGTVLLTNTNGAMNKAADVTPSRDANILTGSGFTRDLVGRTIVVTGVGSAGATVTGRVWGIIDSTHLRVNFNAATTATGVTYTISEDLYATVTASTATGATLDTAAGTTVSGVETWVGTDDAPAIQAAITAAEQAAVNGGNGYTVALRGPSAVGATLLQQKPGELLGYGSSGYSDVIGLGTVRLMPLKPKLTALAYRSSGAHMGVRASMTAGSAVLTDPDASFSAGDVGKAIYVRGAGTQSGSDTQDYLSTTISGFTSSTQVTLAANAATTVTDTVYSYGAGVSLLTGPTLTNVHIVGAPDSKCGLHAMNVCGWTLRGSTVSGFGGGVGVYSDRGSNFNSSVTFHDLTIADCLMHYVCWGTGDMFSGTCNIDGKSNDVGVMPGPGTIGIASNNSSHACGGYLNVQACETWGRFDGSGHIHMDGLRYEACPNGIIIGSDNIAGQWGSYLAFQSWGNSLLGASSLNVGLVLLADVKYVVFQPGFYDGSQINMYGSSDATSLASAQRLDPQIGGAPVQFPVIVARSVDGPTVNNSTTLVDDGVLQFTVPANGIYWFEAFLLFLGDATMDVKIGLFVNNSGTAQWGATGTPASNVVGWGANITTSTMLGMQGANGTMSAGLVGGGARQGIGIGGVIFASTSDALVKIQYAQATAEAANLNMKAGSFLSYTKLA